MKIHEFFFKVGNLVVEGERGTAGKKYFDYLVENLLYDPEDAYADTVIRGMNECWDKDVAEVF